MARKTRILVLSLVVVSVLLALTALIFSGKPLSVPSLPNPNGYDDFLKAAGLLNGDLSNASALDHDQHRALLSTNSESLRLLRLCLTRSCSIPTQAGFTNQTGMLSDLTALKSLA